MSDQDPNEPTRPQPGADQPAADEPTSVMRTTSTTGTGPPPTRPPEPPRSGGVSSGVAIAAALIVGLLGLLIGFLLFDNDDAETDTAAVVDDTDEESATIAELEAERDQLAEEVQDLGGQVEDLESELEEVRQERDELQEQLDDQTETVPAPDVVGSTVEEARSVAEDNGWTFIERPSASPGDAEPGTVVEQYPDPGDPMVEGSVLAVDIAPEPDDTE